MTRYLAALAAILSSVAAAVPSTAQDTYATSQTPAGEACAGCFAYLEFPPANALDIPYNPCGGQFTCIETGSLAETEARMTRDRASLEDANRSGVGGQR